MDPAASSSALQLAHAVDFGDALPEEDLAAFFLVRDGDGFAGTQVLVVGGGGDIRAAAGRAEVAAKTGEGSITVIEKPIQPDSYINAIRRAIGLRRGFGQRRVIRFGHSVASERGEEAASRYRSSKPLSRRWRIRRPTIS